jgi:hypothetical protein
VLDFHQLPAAPAAGTLEPVLGFGQCRGSAAGGTVVRFSCTLPDVDGTVQQRVIATSFFALAAFMTIDAPRSLPGAGEAEHSDIGIVLAAISLAIMPFLSYAQRRASRELGSNSAVADSKQTLLCTYLSAVLLVGLNRPGESGDSGL